MYYTIYKLTNKINGKYYEGAHKTNNLDDGYMGSGSTINKAIKKYGKENFTKEILHYEETEELMYLLEKEVIGDKWKNDPMCYNETPGGAGGFGHIDSSGENNPNYGKALWKEGKSEEEIKEINRKRASHGEANGMYGKTHSDEVKERLRKINTGKKASEETKKKQSEQRKGVPKSDAHKKAIGEALSKNYDKNFPIVQCPHCGKDGRGNAMKQWHFDNCKFKEN